MSLKYEPSSEPLHIAVKKLFLNSRESGASTLSSSRGGSVSRLHALTHAQDYESRLITTSRGSQPSHLGSHMVATHARVLQVAQAV